MRLKAVLGIKSANGAKLIKYRIQDLDNEQIRDIPVGKIIDAIKNKAINIEGIQLKENQLIEINDIPKIPKLRQSSISLYDWCLQNGERGQRILIEFNSANNFPITAKDIASSSSRLKMHFRCTKCHRVSEQEVCSKTSERLDSKCKYCAGQSREISLLDWCNTHKEYGQTLLKEYIEGKNDITPDKVSYGSHRKVYFRCNNCGAVNLEKITDRTNQERKFCIKCDPTSTSFGEQLLLKWLEVQGLEVKSQESISSEAGSKRFDIYLPQLNLVIEHQSGVHKSTEYDINDQLGELIAQQNGINHLEVCELDYKYHRKENQWCITYELYNKHEMIQKLQQWFLKNYNLHLSNEITAEVGRAAWQVKFPLEKYEDSLAYRYPEVAKEFLPDLNYGITPDLIPHNSCYKFWLQRPKDKEPIFDSLSNRTYKYKESEEQNNDN